MSVATIDFIRRADWLDGQRVRGYAAMLAIASCALLANSFVKAMGIDGTDFLAFWGAGHVTGAGDPAAAYDLAVQQQVQTSTGSQGWFAFVNPPPFLFIATPFGMLPFPPAWIAWVAVTYAVWAWAAIRAFPQYWPLVLVFPGALLAAGHAQTGFVTGAMLVASVMLLDRRPIASGVLIGTLIVKPHLALLLPFWLAAGGRWKTFIAAGCSTLGLLALSWLAYGTDTMLAYSTSWDASAALVDRYDPDFFLRMATWWSQLRIHTTEDLAMAVAVASAIAMIALAVLSWKRFGGDSRASGALILAATALASPYLFNYDLPFLIFPILWLVEQGRRHGFRDWEKTALVVLWFAPYATRAAALPLGVNLMPVASIALLWLIWSRGPCTAART